MRAARAWLGVGVEERARGSWEQGALEEAGEARGDRGAPTDSPVMMDFSFPVF